MHPNSSPLAEAERQLELQRQLIVTLTPELYRQLALYLQVLRKGLLHAVQQACFHLATQAYPERFSAIGPSRRLELQERLQALVQRCNCLLTVEQLMGLAAQLQSRQQRQRRRDQQRLLLALAGEEESVDDPDEGESEGEGEDQGEPQGKGESSPMGQPPHRGSVHLGLDLPLSADLFGEGLEGLGAWLAGFARQGDSLEGDASPQEPSSPSADMGPAGPELPDPIEASSPPADSPDLEQDRNRDPEADRQQAADLDQGCDPGPGADPALQTELGQVHGQDRTGLSDGSAASRPPQPAPDPAHHSGPAVDASGERSPNPAQSPGDELDPDQRGELAGEGDQSGSPLQDLGSYLGSPLGSPAGQPGEGPPRSGVNQPASPDGASDGPRRPRRPPFRRGPGPSGGRQRSVGPEGSVDDFQFFQSLFAMAAEGLGRETPGLASPGSAEFGQAEPDQGPGDGSSDGPGDSPAAGESAPTLEGPAQGAGAIPLELLRQVSGLGQAPAPASWQVQGSLMPQDAPSLLAWWEALDGALQRRLRNLSNAVNGELVRLEISRSHLPIVLLDAVLKGQLDPLPAPANLLRLQMPFGGDTPTSPGAGDTAAAFPLGGPLDMVVLLLRPTDLEFEAPALRVCRRRLEQNRARLRTMAQRHRYWQRRVQALEAERQWFQDSPNPSR